MCFYPYILESVQSHLAPDISISLLCEGLWSVLFGEGEGEGRGGDGIGVDEGGGGPERVGGMSSLSLFIILFCEVLYLLDDYICYCCVLSLLGTRCVI